MDTFINPPEFLEEQKKKREDTAKKQKKHSSEQPQRDMLAVPAPARAARGVAARRARDRARRGYYFAPQAQTKIMNEGWASYWHSKILTEKALTDAEIIDFADSMRACSRLRPAA